MLATPLILSCLTLGECEPVSEPVADVQQVLQQSNIDSDPGVD